MSDPFGRFAAWGGGSVGQQLSSVIERIVAARKAESQQVSAGMPTAMRTAAVVEAIRRAYHEDWEKQRLQFAIDFLARIREGIPLPVLSVCGQGTQEIRFSTYLGYFLDGGRPHGLGSRYLDSLLSLLGVADLNTSDAIVETEKWLGQAHGRNEMVNCVCDIVIRCDGHIVFIEQKIKSGESDNPKSETSQLKRYDEAIAANPEFRGLNQVRVFLTPTGKTSSKSPHWQPLSYGDLIDAGLRTYHRGDLSNTAWENLRRFLLDISLGPFDRAERDLLRIAELAQMATTASRFSDRLRFDRTVSRNQRIVDLLMEGSK
ncbi:hypothetical protein EG829_12865 [bacterium]|nr:hypothetical protein [bacterium]